MDLSVLASSCTINMGQLYIPGQKKIQGPWLLEIPELEELNEIFDYIESKVSESYDSEIYEEASRDLKKELYKDIDEAIKGTKEYYEKRKVKRVILVSSDEKRLIDNSLKGILMDPKLKDFKPKELNLDIDYGNNNKFSLQIKTRFDGDLEYTTKCFLQDAQEEIMYKIENWMEKHQPNKAKQIWLEHCYTIMYGAILIALLSGIFIVTTTTYDFKPLYKVEIERLIKAKITDQNRNQATELLLKYVTDYNPKANQQVKKINKIPLQICAISIFCFLVAFFKPTTSIGIGKSKRSTRFYKLYSNFVLFTIPLTFIVPPLIEFIKSAFS